jgi:hypothetical protein
MNLLMATRKSFFRGPERVEAFPAIGRLVRKGSPSALAVSDADRVRDALAANNEDLATKYLSIIRANCEGLLGIYAEFTLAFAPALQKRGLDCGAPIETAYARWKALTAAHQEYRNEPDSGAVLRTLDVYAITTGAGEFRRALLAGQPTLAAALIDGPGGDYEEMIAAIRGDDYAEAAARFDSYFRRMQLIHDLLVDLASLIISAIREHFGQQTAGDVLYEAFTTGSFYEGLWALVSRMSAEERAAFLADHLRAHFSGAAREGSAQVIEEPDRYRLVFAPCGSGGAMRQRTAKLEPSAAAPLPEASRQTWFRAGEVPGYCSHCAINELESIRRLGYPAMVTQFNPDPNQPCGWTVYKDPNLIPDECFERLGCRKEPARFVTIK